VIHCLQNTQSKKGGSVAAVVECLPSKCEALRSNPGREGGKDLIKASVFPYLLGFTFSSFFFSFPFVVVAAVRCFETGSCYVAQAGLELVTFLPQPQALGL
jgi:hypothetical protein